MIPLVLASASPSRLRVLQQAGVDPLVQVSSVDEDALAAGMARGAPPVLVVEELARAKTSDVAGRAVDLVREHRGEEALEAGKVVVVGCDSMLLVGDRLEGKPHTVERAKERWAELRGHHAVLLTGHHLTVLDSRSGDEVYSEAATSDTTVHFGTPSDADLDAYLRTGEPLECAGAFTLESLGGWFIDRITGDPSSVIGLSLPLLGRLLADAGLGVRDLWREDLVAGPGSS